MALRAVTKALVESATGRDVKTIEPNAVALIDRRQRHQAWFCYDLQLQWFLEANEIDLVIDVGANEGQFGRRLRKLYDGEILSFEPVSAAFAELVRVSRDDPRWTVCNLALGSAESTATIHVCADTAFSSLLVPNQFSQERFRRSTVQADEIVRIQRLDGALSQTRADFASRRVFLKLDTQGYDLEVFKGLGTCADRVSLIQAEVSLLPIYDGMPHWTRSIEAFEQAGFCVAGMFPVTRTQTGQVIEYDCLLLRDRR